MRAGADAAGRMLQERVDRGEIAGAVALIARGEAVEVSAAGLQALDSRAPMRRDTIFRIMSMTKPVTAAAAMILVEEGRIALDDPVERFLPELANRRVLRTPDSALDDTVPAARPITLEDLLTLRLGLGWLQSGAAGTSFTIDGTHGIITILLLQRAMRGPDDAEAAAALRRIAYANPQPCEEVK